MRNLNLVYYSILMPTHKSIDYKLSAVKYYLSHSKNQLVKDVIKKNNNLLYAVPYQHYTNAIKGYLMYWNHDYKRKRD